MTGLLVILVSTLGAYMVYVQTVTQAAIDHNVAASLSAAWNRASIQVAAAGPDQLQAPVAVQEDAGVRLDGRAPAPPGSLAQSEGTLVGLVPRGALTHHDGESLGAVVLEPDGGLRVLSDEERHAIVHAVAPLAQGGQTTVTAAGTQYRIQAGEVERPGPWLSPETILVVGMPTEEAIHAGWSGFLLTVVGVVSILVVTLVLGRWWIRRALRPLESVAGVAADLARQDLAAGPVDLSRTRVPRHVLEGADEVAVVGEALNSAVRTVQAGLDRRRTAEEDLRRFAADASHELRTPLASVRGYAEMIALTESLSPQGRRSVERVLSQADRMTDLVDGLLLLARLEAGVYSREAGALPWSAEAVQTVDLCEVILDAVMDARAAWPDHVWVVDVPEHDDTPGFGVPGDVDRVTRIVVNLLSNAGKHTPPGTTVRVSLRLRGGVGETPACVRVRIQDDGGGIPADALPILFRHFVRGVGAHSSKEHSSGLGLPIVRMAARSLGGDVTVASEPGWTRFDVDLPLVGTAHGARAAADRPGSVTPL